VMRWTVHDPEHCPTASPPALKLRADPNGSGSAVVVKRRDRAEPQRPCGSFTIPWKWFLTVSEHAWETGKPLRVSDELGLRGIRSGQHKCPRNNGGD
jgi:hypothetical protein